ncbi:class I SAM-dependent methyltransferase [Actinokineospora enzanensis]|uniref:class I SAM-dependent methyltransferase n=1 Tax=Actinokineospora enzanensis TaxID=155975 RepID=UPI001B7FCD7A|nr:class I SAM-dependent methyltransferase [Actinokineospora enzanensis]
MTRLLLAGPDPDAVARLVDEAGLAAVAAVLVDEVVFRCDPPANTHPVHVVLDITAGTETARTALRLVRDEPPTAVDNDAEPVGMVLRFTAVDLACRLFGGTRRGGDFGNRFLPAPPRDHAGPDPLMRAAAQATGTIMSGLAAAPALGELSVRYGSDKWASFHWYTRHYENYLAPFRDRPIRLLEIGIGGYGRELGGASLRMWRRWFPRGRIVGMDVVDKTALTAPRVTVVVGDQSDPGTLLAVAREHGPFDVVIDDGSHLNAHVHSTFATLFPHVRDGGVYVVEDLQTAYWPSFGGVDTDTAPGHTSVGLLKSLLDGLHHAERVSAATPGATAGAVVGVHVHHNIAFIEKGRNDEDGLPPWIAGRVRGEGAASS